MKIGKLFNELTIAEYIYYIDNHKKYVDFNTLGLFRSILESKKLNLKQQIYLRNYAINAFKKSFEFLQVT